MKFGKRLRQERERRGMTQRELGLKVGLTSGTYISQIESGEKIPPLETSIKFANALGLEDTNPFVFHAIRERSAIEYQYLTSRIGDKPVLKHVAQQSPLPVTSKRFIAVITKEQKWYVAHCVELGVVSQGKTIEEARANLSQAVELYLESFGAEDFPDSTGEMMLCPLEVAVSG